MILLFAFLLSWSKKLSFVCDDLASGSHEGESTGLNPTQYLCIATNQDSDG